MPIEFMEWPRGAGGSRKCYGSAALIRKDRSSLGNFIRWCDSNIGAHVQSEIGNLICKRSYH